MNAVEWEKLLVSATASVWKTVAPLAERGGRGRTVGEGASGDATIYADRKAEEVLLRALKRVPGTKVLSEEAGFAGDPDGESLAIVDPLDGSSNFERGIPFYCTSVAIAEGTSLDDISVGVVRDLVSGAVYTARRGRGARKDGKRIASSDATKTSAAVVGLDLSQSPPGLVPSMAPLIQGVKRQVHFGANALELCLLAEGKTDAFVDLRGRMRITDFAAAYLIAKEGGASITGPDGGALNPSFDLEHRFDFVASGNPVIHAKILGLCARRVRARGEG